MRKRTLPLLFVVFFVLPTFAFGASPKYQRLPLGSVVADGWLRDQLLRSKAGMGGNLDVLEPEMIAKPYVARDHRSKVSPGWSGEISGEYWTGLVQLAWTSGDPDLIEKATQWVEASLQLQEDDGYLGSYRSTENRQEDYCAWSANWHFRALLAQYDATGDAKILEAVHKCLLWFVEHWDGANKTNYAGPTLIEAMIDVYLLTGDERLGRWCVDYVEWLDANDYYRHGRRSLERPRLEFNEDHSVAFGELVKLPALVSLFNNDPSYLAATENGLKQVFERSWQCNGGPVSNFEYHGPAASHHETEYCAYATYLNDFWRMATITGESKYGDLMEWTLFNGAQGARKNDERAIAYNTSPNQLAATSTSSTFGCEANFEAYAPCVQVACCPAQSVRIYPEYVRSLFMRDSKSGALALFAYGPSRAQFKDGENNISIVEKTLYPFDGKIELTIDADSTWKNELRLKKPDWCENWTLSIDGEKVDAEAIDGWIAVEREWKHSVATLEFELKPRVEAIKDANFQLEPLRIVRCGALLFAYRYPENWSPDPGTPLTPLPEGWSWFNVTLAGRPVFYSLALDSLGADGAGIGVARSEPTENVWDNPPLKLTVPMIDSTKSAWPITHSAVWRGRTLAPYENPATPNEGASVEPIELVPFGATTLRQACFTVIK